MKLLKILIITFIFILIHNILFGINLKTKKDTTKKEYPGVVFGNVYAGYYYTINDNHTPKSGFEMSTALLGYTHKISENVKGIIIYDVTRTTNFSYTDTSGISNYFEGSKYTAFLKMAQINWKINDVLELNVGQLLNEQYLTLQDKFWGYRYIAVTFQEMYRFGMPADFGARIKFNINEKVMYSITAVNGEGPFRYQDDDSKFLFSGNFEFRPNKNLIIKLYTDYQMPPDDTYDPRMVFSGFVGYKTDKFKIGAEYNEIFNQGYIRNLNYLGASLYSAYSINEKVDVLGRLDYIYEAAGIEKGQYYIVGIQYRPAEKFYTSINTRYNQHYDYTQLYINFGIKF